LRISESAVSLTTLERLRLQIVERLDRLEKESDLFAEKMIRAAIVEYNRHLREIDAIGKAFAVECDRQHTSQNLQWDKARETARQELVPAANEYISSQMYERFLSLELQKAKETIQATRREYAVNAARIIREVEEKASLADRELRAAGRQCGVMLNQMLNEQCAAEAQTQTHSVTELLTTLRSTVERLPVDQWRRRQVNLRDAGELRNLYQQRVRQARAPHLHDGPELVQHVQPKKPGFFRRHLGKLVGAGAGILLGAGLGAFAGFFLAPVTFGLSIPLFAALGAIAGGAVLGSGVGAGIGAIVDHCCRNKKTRVAPLPSPVAAAQEPVMGLSSQANILRRSGGAGPAHSPRAEQNAHSPQGRISPDIAPVAAVDKTFVPEAVGTSLALK
jgi:hypothetical protein